MENRDNRLVNYSVGINRVYFRVESDHGISEVEAARIQRINGYSPTSHGLDKFVGYQTDEFYVNTWTCSKFAETPL